jgi:hypothetical protein
MKAGYTVAAWRLLQPSLRVPVRRGQLLAWAEAVLASTPVVADTTPPVRVVSNPNPLGTH